ncbi:MAG: hypothetical protein OD814_000898 [Candidatus Alkanophagales archaeon MCA70_species_1]|nr:hypothetical protein [Candidatus Alkanophaga volatiphilum]
MTHLPMQLATHGHLANFDGKTGSHREIRPYDGNKHGTDRRKAVHKIQRARLDEWGVKSHERAAKAVREGYFRNGAGYRRSGMAK